MKKNILIILIIALVIIVGAVIIFAVNKDKSEDGFKVEFNTDNEKVKVGEEVTLEIITNEQIIATNFELTYDKEAFELVGTTTTNLSVAEKNEKVACIYADITGEGTNLFKIKFRAIKNAKAEFAITGAKFRAVDKDESYVQDQIKGIDKILKVRVVK